MNFKLCIVRVFVADWQASLDFYSKVLGMSVLFENAEMGWAELDTGAAHLALERIDRRRPTCWDDSLPLRSRSKRSIESTKPSWTQAWPSWARQRNRRGEERLHISKIPMGMC